MSRNNWNQTLINSQVDGSAVTNTTPLSLLPTQAKYTLIPNWDLNVGSKLRIRAAGRISTVVTTPGTLTLDVRFGSVIVATSPAFALNIVAKTNVTWKLEWDLVVRAIAAGVNSNLMHTGMWSSEAVIGSPLPTVGGSGSLLIPASAPAVGTSFDNSLTTNTVDLFATWSVNNASNTLLCHEYELILCN